MTSRYPFTQKRLNENTILRKFSRSVSESQLEWHRDHQDRVVEVLYGDGWMFQRDESVPVQINEGTAFKIKANEWHRIIKGSDSDLVLMITEGSSKKLSKKQKKIAAAAPPSDEITGDDFRALRKSKKPKKDIDELAVKSRMRRQNDRSGYSSGTIKDLVEDEKEADEKKKVSDNPKCAEEKSLIRLSESQLSVMINDIVEELVLDPILNKIEGYLKEKRKKK